MESTVSDEISDLTRCSDIEQLEAFLKEQLRGRVHGLRVLLCGNGVVLSGHSDSFYGKQLAQHVLMKTTRLQIVANDIQVPLTTRRMAEIAS